jgi:2-dehydro-3-deoxygluconokinase
VSNPTEAQPFDVVAMGEILLEVATDVPFGHGVPAQLGISGDALNVAAAAAAAGARTALLAVLPDDDLGQAVAARIAELGISTDLLKFRPGQQGVYLVHCDPDGQREFSYARSGSVGSTLGPDRRRPGRVCRGRRRDRRRHRLRDLGHVPRRRLPGRRGVPPLCL